MSAAAAAAAAEDGRETEELLALLCSGMILELFNPGDLSEGGGDLRHVDTDNV